ncbi:MAG: YigZ family protein [Flavobacteriales bacterium]
MSDITEYNTLIHKGESMYRVLGSKHIGLAYEVYSEEEIKIILDQLWTEHHQATHICYAWRIGWEKKHYRINDDGEPSGTAGKPIYGQIQSFDLTNVLVAVIRYYGGTKLGTSGLIDAYKTASKLAIENAEIKCVPVMDHYKATFSYEVMPAAMKLLKDLDFEKIDAPFAEKAHVEFLISKPNAEILVLKSEEIGIELEFLGRR